jgi:hypothetical protein
LERKLEERVGALFPRRSYGSALSVALWSKGLLDADNLDALPRDKAEISASKEHFGLGAELYKQCRDAGGVRPSSLRCGHVYPERLVIGGLVSIRTVGELLDELERVFVVGDPGVAVLLTFLVVKFLPLQSGAAWSALYDMPKDTPLRGRGGLGEARVLELLESLQYTYLERKCRANQQFRVSEAVTREAAAAAADLSSVSRETGGNRAADAAALERYQRAFDGHFEALYTNAMNDALGGRAHDRLTTAKKRVAAAAATVVQGVAELRLLLRLRELERASATGAVEFDEQLLDGIVADVFRPATAFDGDVIAAIGDGKFNTSRRNFDPVPLEQFRAALSKTLRVFGVGEAYSSQREWLTGVLLERFSATSFRLWNAPDEPHNVQNKDVCACKALLKKFLVMLTLGKKPARWCPLDQVLAAPELASILARVPKPAPKPSAPKQPPTSKQSHDRPPDPGGGGPPAKERRVGDETESTQATTTEQPTSGQKRPGADAAGVPKHARTSDKPAGAFGSDEELRRSLAAFQANERAQFARPVPQRQSTQTDHFMTNPGAPQGVGGAAAQSASPAATAPVVAKRKQPASELHTT